MRRRMNQYPSNTQHHFNQNGWNHQQQGQYGGYPQHQGPYGGYPQQPYYQPNHQHYYGSQRPASYYDNHYESRNPTLFYLLIILAFVAYGGYQLNKNYGTTGNTGQSTVDVPTAPVQVLDNTTTTLDPNLNNNFNVPNDYDYSGGIAPPEEITDVGENFSGQEQILSDNQVYVVETPVQTSAPVRTFYVQEHVYENWENARTQQAKLISKGRKAIIVQLDDGSLLYRLIVGEFSTEAEAIARAQKLKSGRVFELANGRIYEL